MTIQDFGADFAAAAATTPAGHAAGVTYDMAFLGSTGVEVAAVLILASMLGGGILRTIIGSNAFGERWDRLWRRVGAARLHKMIIPLMCLTLTVWVWLQVRAS